MDQSIVTTDYSGEFDYVNNMHLGAGWYRMCYDVDGNGGAMAAGWSDHLVYLSGIYNAASYGIQRKKEFIVYMNCQGCTPNDPVAQTGSLAYLSRNCENTTIVGGGLYGTHEIII